MPSEQRFSKVNHIKHEVYIRAACRNSGTRGGGKGAEFASSRPNNVPKGQSFWHVFMPATPGAVYQKPCPFDTSMSRSSGSTIKRKCAKRTVLLAHLLGVVLSELAAHRRGPQVIDQLIGARFLLEQLHAPDARPAVP